RTHKCVRSVVAFPAHLFLCAGYLYVRHQRCVARRANIWAIRTPRVLLSHRPFRRDRRSITRTPTSAVLLQTSRPALRVHPPVEHSQETSSRVTLRGRHRRWTHPPFTAVPPAGIIRPIERR